MSKHYEPLRWEVRIGAVLKEADSDRVSDCIVRMLEGIRKSRPSTWMDDIQGEYAYTLLNDALRPAGYCTTGRNEEDAWMIGKLPMDRWSANLLIV
jgi:hypothetical protein